MPYFQCISVRKLRLIFSCSLLLTPSSHKNSPALAFWVIPENCGAVVTLWSSATLQCKQCYDARHSPHFGIIIYHFIPPSLGHCWVRYFLELGWGLSESLWDSRLTYYTRHF
jgi:hypothetical protein